MDALDPINQLPSVGEINQLYAQLGLTKISDRRQFKQFEEKKPATRMRTVISTSSNPF